MLGISPKPQKRLFGNVIVFFRNVYFDRRNFKNDSIDSTKKPTFRWAFLLELD